MIAATWFLSCIPIPISELQKSVLPLSSNRIDTGLPQKIVALITSNLKRTGPTRVHVNRDTSEGQSMGLLTDSVIVTDNLATVLEREIDKKIGICSAMDDVDKALRNTLGL